MKKIRAVVIDDEFYNRGLISKLVVKTHAGFDIVATAEDIEEGYELINSVQPDLVFLDIKMPGGSGFDLLRKFENPSFEVVFVTGFDEYAIQAFDFNALDYILKPIDTVKLEKTLNKVYHRIYNQLSITDNLKEITKLYHVNSAELSKIPIHVKDKVVLLTINDIISIQSEDGYTAFTDVHSNKCLSAKSLSDFEFIFDAIPHFVRLHKSIYVNSNHMKHYSKGQICIITLTDNSTFEVSRRKKTEILAFLDTKLANNFMK
jgi:two-component system LytT family response regulator